MEVLSLLKFWRTAAGDSTAGDIDIRNRAPDIDDEVEAEEDSFFDLVFTGADCELKQQNLSSHLQIKDIDNEEDYKNKIRLQKSEAGETKKNQNPIETHSKPQSPISLLKNPYKFRVFMFGFKEKTQSSESMAMSKRFSMRYTVVEEEIPIRAILGRDNSLRSKMQREKFEDSSPVYELGKKDVTGVQKYLKKIRPLYIKASSRIKLFDQSLTVTPFSSPRKFGDEKHGRRTTVFRGACRSLVKNRWASSSIGEVPSPVNRRDDSMLQQQQDGIQSAILHCKRSFSSSSSSSTRSQECTVLSRSASDSSHQKAINPPRISVEEEKRSSI